METYSKAVAVVTFVVIVSVYVSGTQTIGKGDDSENGNIRSRRFIMTHHSNMPWMSWRQHVACLTTCIKGYETETVACCTTGDNRLCFNLPFALLNASVGSCPDFCHRKSDINCGTASSQVCGSDGVTYANMCEFSKAVCENDTLTEVKSGPCIQVTTPMATAAVTLDPLFQVFCANKDTVTCPNDIDLVCDSDKRLYKNRCEFAKHRCNNFSLMEKPISFCRAKK